MTQIDTTDPAAALQAATSHLADITQPEIQIPYDNRVALSYGIQVNGVWHRDAEVREINGFDEEAISKVDVKAADNAIMALTHALIHRATEQIGALDLTSDATPLWDLTIGDREHLLLHIAVATYGREREFDKVPCPSCEAENDIVIDLLEDIPIKRPEDPNKLTLQFDTKQGPLVVRLPTGADQRYLFQEQKGLLGPERNSKLIARTLQSVGGEYPRDPEFVAKSLSAKERSAILDGIVEAQCGPQLREVKVNCARCGTENSFGVNWMILLPFLLGE